MNVTQTRSRTPAFAASIAVAWVGAAVHAMGGETPAPGGTPPRSTNDTAAGPPPLVRAAGEGGATVVQIPLTTRPPHVWTGIRPGITVETKRSEDGGGEVLWTAYTRTRGKPAGAALIICKGDLAGLQTLRLTMRGSHPARLSIAMREDDGEVWSTPMFTVGEEAVVVSLAASAVKFDPFQNSGRAKGGFDPASVVMITVLDIDGFMSIGEPDIEWTMSDLRAECTSLDLAAEQSTDPAVEQESPPTAPPSPPSSHSAPVHTPSPPTPPPGDASGFFFDALNHHPERRAVAAAGLMRAYMDNPIDPELTLHLGLAHLWMAGEGVPGEADSPAARFEHLVLAAKFLGRARELNPTDRRIVSWDTAARIHLARLEHDDAALAVAQAEQRAGLAEDPCFHSVGFAIGVFDAPADSAEFREGLKAMRAAMTCSEGDLSGINRPRWPHNVEGFLLGMAQFEAKAGETQQARALLAHLRNRQEFESWPHRALALSAMDNLKALVDSWRDEDPKNDPPFVLGPRSAAGCTVCHQGQRPASGLPVISPARPAAATPPAPPTSPAAPQDR